MVRPAPETARRSPDAGARADRVRARNVDDADAELFAKIRLNTDAPEEAPCPAMMDRILQSLDIAEIRVVDGDLPQYHSALDVEKIKAAAEAAAEAREGNGDGTPTESALDLYRVEVPVREASVAVEGPIWDAGSHQNRTGRGVAPVQAPLRPAKHVDALQVEELE